MEKVDAVRAVGNALFALKRYEDAAEEYSRGISSDEGLLSNRAACYLQLKRYDEASEDAWRATKTGVKAWYRAGLADIERGDVEKAWKAAKKALELAPRDRQIRELWRRVDKKKKEKLLRLYDDKENALEKGASDDAQQRKAARDAIRRLKEMVRASNFQKETSKSDFETCLQTLLDPAGFRATVFPGAPPSRDLPKTLLEFLDDPKYAKAAEDAWPRAKRKAGVILEGTKARGAKEGDDMDAETEARLWPAIVREAFCRELASAVQDVARADLAKFQQDQQNELRQRRHRDPIDFALPKELPGHLSASSSKDEWTGVACVVHEFLGADWSAVVYDDARRLARSKRVAPGLPSYDRHSPGDIAWLDVKDLDDEFPALAELASKLGQLHVAMAGALDGSSSAEGSVEALPLPAAPDLGDLLGLQGLLPAASASLFVSLNDTHVPLPPRIDQNNAVFSALYFVNDSASGGDLILEYDGHKAVVPPTPDALVLWRSSLVSHSRSPAQSNVLSVAHWVYGGYGKEANLEDIPPPPPSGEGYFSFSGGGNASGSDTDDDDETSSSDVKKEV